MCLDRLLQAFEKGELKLEEADCISGTKPEEAILVAEIDRYGLPINTYLDPKTGLLWSSPRLTEASAATFYEHHYRGLYHGRQQPNERFIQLQISRGKRILEHVKPFAEGGLVLDIGCGAGGSLLPFRDAGWRCAGCDYEQAYLDYGLKLGLDLRFGGAESLSGLPPADLVFARHVLEHTFDPGSAIAEWRGLLAPNGLVCIEVPGLFRAYEDYGTMERFFHIAHTYHFTLSTLIELAARHRLEFLAGDESVYAVFRAVNPGPGVLDVANGASGATEPKRIQEFLSQNEDLAHRLGRTISRPLRRAARKRRLKQIGGIGVPE